MKTSFPFWKLQCLLIDVHSLFGCAYAIILPANGSRKIKKLLITGSFFTKINRNYKVAKTVTPPFTIWFSCTDTFAVSGSITSTLLPNFMKPSSLPWCTSWPIDK